MIEPKTATENRTLKLEAKVPKGGSGFAKWSYGQMSKNPRIPSKTAVSEFHHFDQHNWRNGVSSKVSSTFEAFFFGSKRRERGSQEIAINPYGDEIT